MYKSFSSAVSDNGPNNSSGVVYRVSRRSKNLPPHILDSLLPNSDLPVPGGPNNNICSLVYIVIEMY